MTITRTLCIWTIYDHPRDFPDHIVVRETRIYPNADTVWVRNVACLYGSLAEAQTDLERTGLSWMPRWPNDDPKIIGVWM